MTAKELKLAIKAASRIICFVSIRKDNHRKSGVVVSKRAMMRAANAMPADIETRVQWCDQEGGVLLIG